MVVAFPSMRSQYQALAQPWRGRETDGTLLSKASFGLGVLTSSIM